MYLDRHPTVSSDCLTEITLRLRMKSWTDAANDGLATYCSLSKTSHSLLIVNIAKWIEKQKQNHKTL